MFQSQGNLPTDLQSKRNDWFLYEGKIGCYKQNKDQPFIILSPITANIGFIQKDLRLIPSQCINSITPEAYPESNQTSKMKLFAKSVNGFQPLTIFTKGFSLIFEGVLNTPLYSYTG